MKWLVCLAAAWMLTALCSCSGYSTATMSDAEFRRRIKEYNARVDRQDQLLCEKVRPVGSNIPRWVCRSAWAKNAEKVRTQEVLRRIQKSMSTQRQ